MISERKKYIIKLFLKRCTNQDIMRDNLVFAMKIVEESYFLSEKDKEKIKNKYTIDDYIERLLPTNR